MTTYINDIVFDQLNHECNEYSKVLLPDAYVNALKNGPAVLTTEDCFPEVHCAMDLPVFSIPVFAGVLSRLPGAFELIDRSKEMGVGSRSCTGVKMAMYLVEAGLYPKPTALFTGNNPCDVIASMGNLVNAYKPWADVPKYFLSAPHDRDEESMINYGRQMRAAADFLEKTTGKKLDLDRLKQVCEESNKQCRLMLELQVLKSAIPTPIDWSWGRSATTIARWGTRVGNPVVTDWLQRLVAATEKRVKAKKGLDGIAERIRYVWFDFFPTIGPKLFPRLAKELGAVSLMDFYNWGGPWIPIDTSSEEAMFTSFAKRYVFNTPMMRHAFGTLESVTAEIQSVYMDLKCDAVVIGGNIGHKEQNVIHKAMLDICRDRNIPAMVVGCDVWDERYMSADQVFDKIKTFFEVVGLPNR